MYQKLFDIPRAQALWLDKNSLKFMMLWGLNAYLALWKQKYTSQKFSKKYKNSYFCPTLELVKITMDGLNEICAIFQTNEIFSFWCQLNKKNFRQFTIL